MAKQTVGNETQNDIAKLKTTSKFEWTVRVYMCVKPRPRCPPMVSKSLFFTGCEAKTIIKQNLNLNTYTMSCVEGGSPPNATFLRFGGFGTNGTAFSRAFE